MIEFDTNYRPITAQIFEPEALPKSYVFSAAFQPNKVFALSKGVGNRLGFSGIDLTGDQVCLDSFIMGQSPLNPISGGFNAGSGGSFPDLKPDSILQFNLNDITTSTVTGCSQSPPKAGFFINDSIICEKECVSNIRYK